MRYHITRGFDIPLRRPPPHLQHTLWTPYQALYLEPVRLPIKLLRTTGDTVTKGEPLAHLVTSPDILFVTPTSGTIHSICYAETMRVRYIILEKNPSPPFCQPLSPSASPQEILSFLAHRGLFLHIQQRPFGTLPDLNYPDAIFVSLVDSSPLAPQYTEIIQHREEDFLKGLHLLSSLSKNNYLIIPPSLSLSPPPSFQTIRCTGPHPSGSFSLHIQLLYPITHPNQRIWTLRTQDVITLGATARSGIYHTDHLLVVGGESSQQGYYRTEIGMNLSSLVSETQPWILGSPLHGRRVSQKDYIGIHESTLTALRPCSQKKILPFLRIGNDQLSYTRAYPSGWRLSKKGYLWTNATQGEERPFIDPGIYQKITPLSIKVVPLIKSILAKDFETARHLGLLEVVPEDFELPAFVCPSKIDLMGIVQQGLYELERITKQGSPLPDTSPE